jgi:hypothetical protein
MCQYEYLTIKYVKRDAISQMLRKIMQIYKKNDNINYLLINLTNYVEF